MSDKHNDSINCLIDSLEAMLNQFEKFGIDPEEIAESGQFQVFMHGKGKLYRYEEGKWFSGFWKDDDLEESVDDWDVGNI